MNIGEVLMSNARGELERTDTKRMLFKMTGECVTCGTA